MKAVYVIAEEGGDRCKVGIATDPKDRIQALQTAHSRRLYVVGAWRTAGADDLERAAHEHLAAHRLVGEWFAVSPAVAGFSVGWAAARLGLDIEPVNLALVCRETQRHPSVPLRPAVIAVGDYAANGGASALRNWREQRGLSTRDLALMLQTNASTVSRMERGESRPSLTMTQRLTTLTGLTVEQLMAPSLAQSKAESEAA